MENLLIFLFLLLFILPVSVKTQLIIFFAYMAVEGFLKHLTMYSPVVHTAKYVIPLVIYIKLFLFSRRPGGFFAKTPLNRLIFLYFLVALLQLLNPLSYSDDTGGFLLAAAGLTHHLIYIPLFFISYSFVNTKEDFYKLIMPIIFILALANAFAIVQMVQGLDFWANLTPSFLAEYEHFGYGDVSGIARARPFSTFTTPYTLALSCMIEIFLCWSLIGWRRKLNKFVFPAIIAFIAICIVDLVFTFIRTIILEIAVGFLVILAVKKKAAVFKYKNILLILLIIFAVSKTMPLLSVRGKEKLATVTQPVEAFKEGRGHIFKNALEVLMEYPFGAGMGRGLGTNLSFFYKGSGKERVPFVAESNFITVMADFSVLGLLVAMLILARLFKSGYRVVNCAKDRDISWSAACLLGLLVGMMPHCPVAIAFDSAYFWFLSGILLSFGKFDNS